MKVADLRDLGFLPLQDHGLDHPLAAERGIPDVSLRNVPGACRFMGWDLTGRPIIEQTGDVVGAVVALNKENQREFTPAWAFAMPTSWQGGREGQTVSAEQSQTRSPFVFAAAPIFEKANTDRELPVDDRLQPIEAYPPGFKAGDEVPRGHAGVVISAIREDRQEPVFFPADRRLVAANKAGRAPASNHVYDLNTKSEFDSNRRAPLHSHLRVVKTTGTFPGKQDALAWNLSGGGLDGCIGGLVHDRLPGKTRTGQQEDGTVALSPEAKKTTTRVETSFNPYVKNNNDTPTSDLHSQTRDPSAGQDWKSEAKNPPKSGNEDEPTVIQADVLSVVAHASYRYGGPFSPGPGICQHDMGATLDGESQRPVHLDIASLFTITEDPLNRDGPLPFSGDPWANPPRYERVNYSEIVWDPKAPHTWRAGDGLRGAWGRWKIQGTVPYQQVDGGTRYPPPPPQPPPPLPPPLPPPRPPGGTGVRLPGEPGGPPSVGGGGVRGPGVPPEPQWVIDWGLLDPSIRGLKWHQPPPGEGGKPPEPDPGVAGPGGHPLAIFVGDGTFNANEGRQNGIGVLGFDPNVTPPTLVTPGPRPATVFPQPVMAGEIGLLASPTGDQDADPARGHHPEAETAGTPTGGKFIGVGTSTPSGQPVTRGTGECGNPLSAVEGIALVPGCTKPNEINEAEGSLTAFAPPGQAIGVGSWDPEVGLVSGVVTRVDDDGNMEFVIKDADGEVDNSHSLVYGPNGLIYDGEEVSVGGVDNDPFGGTGALGNVTISSNTQVSGTRNYADLTVDAGFALTAPAGEVLDIRATGDVLIDGTLGSIGSGPLGGAGGAGSAGRSGGVSSAGSPGQQGAAGTYVTASGGGGGGGVGGAESDVGTPGTGNGGDGADGRDRAYPHASNAGTGGTGGTGMVVEGHGASAGSSGTASADPQDFLEIDFANEPAATLPLGAPGSGGGGASGGASDGTGDVGTGGSGGTPSRPNGGGGSDGGGGGSVDFGGGGGGGAGGPGGGGVCVDARGDVTISATGSIITQGGDGGDGGDGGANTGGPLGASGGGGGAGSPGAGGPIRIRHGGTYTVSGTVNANPGSIGTAGTGDVAGLWDGSPGGQAGTSDVGPIIIIQMT